MRNLTTELKVGLLILGGLSAIVYGSVVVTGWRPGVADAVALYIHFDNASGLLPGSPVQVAGVKVGQVEEIALHEGQARVRVSVFRSFTLYTDATATIKSLGILGDKYVELRPGSPGQAQLQDGDTIVLVLPGGDLDSLVDNLSHILNDVRSVTASLRDTLGGDAGRDRLDGILDAIAKGTTDISRITDATNRQIDTILGNLNAFAANLERMTGENRDGLRATITNFAAFSDDLRRLTEGNREALDRIIANLDTFVNALGQDGPQITDDLRRLLADNREGLTRAVANLDTSFSKLDQTMGNLESVSAKLDRGEGTIGRLLNDESTVEELNEALAGVNRFLTSTERIKLDIGGHVEYLSDQGEYKGYLDIRIQPLKDRYYLLQLVDNPRGKVTTRSTTITEGPNANCAAPPCTFTEAVSEDKLQLSLIIAQRYFDTVIKGGVMENSFGVGVEQLFGRDDQWRIGLDVWDFGNEFGPHVKLTGYWRFFSNAFLVIGGDDLASDNKEFRDAFFGIGVHFNEDSLKPLLSSLPIGDLAGN